MLDVALGVIGLVVIVRGWRRGSRREATALLVTAVALVASYRLSSPVGAFVATVGGVGGDKARLIAGLLVLAVIMVGPVWFRLAVGRRRKAREPEVWTESVYGAVLAVVGTLLLVAVLASIVMVVRMPGLVAAVESSQVGGRLADPDGAVHRLLALVGGDQALRNAVRLRSDLGVTQLGDPGDGHTAMPSVDGARLTPNVNATAELSRLVNEARVVAGAAPLLRSGDLDAVAGAHGLAVYAAGELSHSDSTGADQSARLAAAGIPHVVTTELLGLGVSLDGVLDAWRVDSAALTRLNQAMVRRVGLAVIDGPLGKLAVVVMAG